MEETAVNLAHRFANAAEEYQEMNMWEEAVDMHFKAADQYILALNDTQDKEVIRTLKLMNANHIRQGKDLQRRIVKVTAEVQPQMRQQSVNQYGSSPKQNPVTTNSASGGPVATGSAASRRRSNSEHNKGGGVGTVLRQTNLTLQQNLSDPMSRLSVKEGYDGLYHGGSSGASSNSSSAMVEESFTLVKNHVKDDSDPFNKFWEAVENLVLKISSPVAFTSIPLDGDDPIPHSPTSEEPPALDPTHMPPFMIHDRKYDFANDNTLKVPSMSGGYTQSHRETKSQLDPSFMQESFFIIDAPTKPNSTQRGGHSRNHSMPISDTSSAPNSVGSNKSTSASKRYESSGMLAAPRPTKTLEEYAIENSQLKSTLDKLSKRNLKLEKNLEGVMQMSVWTKDVQRSAMQLIKSQDVLRPMKQSVQDIAGGSILPQRIQTTAGAQYSTPSASIIGSNPATMHTRLQELETEVLQLSQENAKINSLMKKYKQRWEDLKESAKKRRNASATSTDVTNGESTNNDTPTTVNHQATQKPFGEPTPGSGPFASSTLVSSPNSYSTGGINSNISSGSTRPLSSLMRSNSNSGSGLGNTGGYQKRILENMTGGKGLDSTPLSVRRQSTGIVSSTTPRVLDSSSPRVLDSSSPRPSPSGFAALPDIQRPNSNISTTPPFSIAPSPAMNAHIVTATGTSPQLGSNAVLSTRSQIP
ncbi:hypothetical protein BGZ76_001845 [Entomortierella beljakovae]|nr:hypothetical protein BGZ76_001845 [Entomortierella beljakovae]